MYILGIKLKKGFIMNIEQATDTQYVKSKLQSKAFKLKEIMTKTGISRHMMRRVVDGLPVKPFVIITLNDYFRKLSE
jgi:hypothetical protein